MIVPLLKLVPVQIFLTTFVLISSFLLFLLIDPWWNYHTDAHAPVFFHQFLWQEKSLQKVFMPKTYSWEKEENSKCSSVLSVDK
jgi:hypothetical protein